MQLFFKRKDLPLQVFTIKSLFILLFLLSFDLFANDLITFSVFGKNLTFDNYYNQNIESYLKSYFVNYKVNISNYKNLNTPALTKVFYDCTNDNCIIDVAKEVNSLYSVNLFVTYLSPGVYNVDIKVYNSTNKLLTNQNTTITDYDYYTLTQLIINQIDLNILYRNNYQTDYQKDYQKDYALPYQKEKSTFDKKVLVGVNIIGVGFHKYDDEMYFALVAYPAIAIGGFYGYHEKNNKKHFYSGLTGEVSGFVSYNTGYLVNLSYLLVYQGVSIKAGPQFIHFINFEKEYTYKNFGLNIALGYNFGEVGINVAQIFIDKDKNIFFLGGMSIFALF